MVAAAAVVVLETCQDVGQERRRTACVIGVEMCGNKLLFAVSHRASKWETCKSAIRSAGVRPLWPAGSPETGAAAPQFNDDRRALWLALPLSQAVKPSRRAQATPDFWAPPDVGQWGESQAPEGPSSAGTRRHSGPTDRM